MRKTLFSFLFLFGFYPLLSQNQTVQITVTNGNEIRCAGDSLVTVQITPDPSYVWTSIYLNWGDSTAPVTLSPGSNLTQSHLYSTYMVLQNCNYNCAFGLNGGACFPITVIANYQPPTPQQNVSKIITFKRPPTANFSTNSPICQGDQICVTPNYCPTNDNTSVFTWNYNGITTNIAPSCYPSNSSGNQLITFTHTNMCGTATQTKTVQVNAPPIANLTPSPIGLCKNDTAFMSSSSSLNAGSVSWSVSPSNPAPPATQSWIFVSGSTSSTNVGVKFTLPGYYVATLTVNNSPCPSSQDTANIRVDAPIVMSITKQQNVCNTLFNYTPIVSINTNAHATLTYAQYNASTGNFVPFVPPTTINPSTNPVIVGVTASNHCGTVVVYDTFFVKPVPVVVANASSPTSICKNDTVFFSGLNSQNAMSYSWAVSPGNAPTDWQFVGSNLQATAKIIFKVAGVYNVTLYVNNNPCAVVASTVVQVTVNNAPTLSLLPQPDACAPFAYTPSPQTVGASYVLKNCTTGAILNQPYTNLPAGTYCVTATLSNLCGAQTKKDTFVVSQPPTACISPPSNTTLCIGASLPVNANCSQNAVSYSWNNGSVTPSTTYNFTSVGNATITLMANAPGCPSSMQSLTINVISAPVLSLNSQPDACAPFSYAPDPQTAGAAYVLKNCTTGATLNPPYSNLPAGIYCVTATLSNLCGMQTKTDTFQVFAPVSACIAYAGNDTVCVGATVSVNASCSQNAGSLLWSNGATSSATSYTFTTPGSVLISLTASSAGCPAASQNLPLTVLNAPLLTLTPQPDACAPFSYAPSPQTAGASYVLKNCATGATVSPPYSNLPAGTYCVTATLSNLCGVQTKTDTFQVFAPVSACIAYAGPATVCAGSTIQLGSACSQHATTYSWSNGASTPTTSYTFTNAGTQVITLLVGNPGCPSVSTTLTIVVENPPVLALSPQPDICLQLSYSPQPQYYPLATYTINGNVVTNFPYNMTLAGSPYFVQATITNTCTTFTYKDTIHIFGPVPVQIVKPTQDTLVCKNATLQLSALPNDGVGKFWLNGTIINSPYTFSNSGNYTVMYIRGTGNCETRDSVKVEVQNITVFVKDTTVCQNGVPFTLNADTNPPGGQTYWYSSSCPNCVSPAGMLQIPVFPPALTSLAVTCVYQTPQGCKDSSVLTVTNVPINAQFDFLNNTPCTSDPIGINLSGAVYQNVIWKIDGLVAGLPPFSPLPAGIHTITMVCISGNCMDSLSKTIVVTPPPSAAVFAPSAVSGCTPLQINIIRLDTPQATVSYSWNFGRGNSDNFIGFQPTNPILYQNNSDSIQYYTVSVLAQNFCGSAVSDTIVAVLPMPFAAIGIDSTTKRCSPFHALLTNRSTGLPTSAVWDFGDGTPPVSTMDSVVFHTFYSQDSIRTFVVMLVAANECGTDTAFLPVTVIPPYIASYFTMDNYRVCPNTPIQFQDASTPPATSVLWNFGDGNTSSAFNPIHTYALEDTLLTVTLYATNECGYDSISHSVRILRAPKPNFTVPSLNCQNQPMQFQNLTQGNYTYSWDFGDGGKDSLKNPSYVFMQPGSHIVTLQAFSYPERCVGYFSKEVSVQNQPIADFAISNERNCYPAEQVVFTNLSQYANTYTWYFGDGKYWENAGNVNTGHYYTSAGEFDVKLIATFHNKCVDSITKPKAVIMDFCTFFIPSAFTPNGDGFNEIFMPVGYNVKSIDYLEIFDRWGKIVYKAYDIDANGAAGWDGTLDNGDFAPEGVYVYKLRMRYVDDSLTEERRGTVSLLR